MKLIMLDGWAAGQVFSSPDGPPEYKIVKPINTGYFVDDWDELLMPEIIIYKRAFVSFDGKMTLYTTDGKSERLIDGNRDWCFHTKYPLRKKDAIHFIEK